MNRRQVVECGAVAAAAPALAFAATSDPVVTTTAGPIRGLLDRGVYASKGVPYGAPTGGATASCRPSRRQPGARCAATRRVV